MRTIVCYKCAEKFSLLKQYFNANIRVLGKQGTESNCGLCGKDSGGSDIVVPHDIMERARKAANKATSSAIACPSEH